MMITLHASYDKIKMSYFYDISVLSSERHDRFITGMHVELEFLNHYPNSKTLFVLTANQIRSQSPNFITMDLES
jgi:hypothetical protein